MNRPALTYDNFEKLNLGPPVDRLAYMSEACRDKVVLDVGCLDETALIKRDTEHWLHGRITTVATRVIGVDSSAQIPQEGLVTSGKSRIFRADATTVDPTALGAQDVEIVVAGEFIEHIERPLEFLRHMRELYPGRQLIFSTPNGVGLANTLMGLMGREAQHPDHLYNFTFKTLNTACLRAGFARWKITPYHFHATEMILRSHGLKRRGTRLAASFIRRAETAFPLLSFGYIVRADL